MRSPGSAGPLWPTVAASVVSTDSAGGVETAPQAWGTAVCAGRAPRRRLARSAFAAASVKTETPLTHAAFEITAAGGSDEAASTANTTVWLEPAGTLARLSVQLEPAAVPAHDQRTSLAPASKLERAGTVSLTIAAPRS